MTPAIEELRLGDPVPYRIREEQRRAVREFVRELNAYARDTGNASIDYRENPDDEEVLAWLTAIGLGQIQKMNAQNAAMRGGEEKAA